MTEQEFKDLCAGKMIMCMPTGSRVICDPPVMDTDIDYVICGPVDLEKHGFRYTNDNDEYEDTDFETYRNGDLNVIKVDNGSSFAAWEWATRAAKSMNLTDKGDRISFFQGCLYGNW